MRAELAVAEAGALQRAQHVGRHAAQPDQRRPTLASSTICENWVRNQGSIFVSSWICSTVQPRSSARNTAHIRRSFGIAQLALQRRVLFLVGQAVAAVRGLRRTAGRSPSSSERNAFMNASLNVRPIAITSPTDFICVVSVAIGLRELLERPARDLDDDVVDGRLERRRRERG